MNAAAAVSPQRILVVLPNWVGDVVLASPTLAALRHHFSSARIWFLARRGLWDLLGGCGWHDHEITWPRGAAPGSWLALLQTLRAARFDTALLLTNAFRSALVAWLAGAAQRIGYARDGRGLFLTHALTPLRSRGVFTPAPITPAYARVAQTAGCRVTDLRLRLGMRPEDEREARRVLDAHGVTPQQPYAVLNPGAAFGAAKCWLPERFAELGDRLHRELGLLPLLVGAPGERTLLDHIVAQSRMCKAIVNPPTTLAALKPLIRDARLLVCNDSGPRHLGVALGVPTVTIFGPTHQAWTATDYPWEVCLQARVPCGPCQLRVCPVDHRCMKQITVAQVLAAAQGLLARRSAPQPSRLSFRTLAHAAS